MSECKVCKGKGYHKLSCPNNDKKPIKIGVEMKAGIIWIPNEPPRAKLPRKKKKQYIKYMGPKAYKQYLVGVPQMLITSDYGKIVNQNKEDE